MGVMSGWPRILPVDYLAPAEASFVSLAQGTTSNNFDFGPATGVLTTPTPPTASYKVNTGTLTLGTVTWTGTAWRVPVSGMTDGISGTIKLSFRAADGQITSQITGFRVAPAPTTDYIAPAAPAVQALAIGTTTANVDFGAATGQTTSGTPGASYRASTGTVTLGAVTWTGSAWRVPITGLSDGQSVEVELDYTASDGQITSQCGMVVVGASAVSVWKTVKEYDFTDCTAKDISAEGTHNVFKGDGTTPLIDVVRSHTGTTAATFTGNFVNGSGCVMSQVTGATDARNATAAFDMALASLDLAHNTYYIEMLCNTAELETYISAAPTLNLSVQAQSGGAGEPAFGLRFDRTITNWRRSSRKRFSGTATNEATVNGAGAEIPTTMNIGLWISGGNVLKIYVGTSATYQGPLAFPSDYVATAYGDTQAGSATDADAWSAGKFLVYSATNQTVAGGATTLTIKGFKISSLQPEA